jgi:hypothetical protein
VPVLTEVESFLDNLYESDPASHQLVNQAILILERKGPADDARGWRLAEMRKRRGLTQEQVAVRIGCGLRKSPDSLAKARGNRSQG